MNRAAGREPGAWASPGARASLAAAALVLLALLPYWQVRGHGFVVFDDDRYITENAVVRGGLTWAGARWAFTTFHVSNWHPLTWLSHMADVSLFGLDAGSHHLANVFFHAVNTVLLFLVLRRTTGSLWRSGLAAALFGVHPLHVESVAWVSERKDLLSGLFFFLGVWAYARYAERPGARRYVAVALFFVLGLLSKPMVVTFPFVLLLLDWWPLGRFRAGAVRPLVLEKVPLFALSAASCAVTYLAQQKGGAVGSLDALPIASRLSNGALSYGTYLWKAAWPSGLAVFYPHPGGGGGSVPLWGVLGSAGLLAALTAVAVRFRGRGYPVTGWLWYLGMLVPVIGVVQVGAQAMADRYTYLPLVGAFVALSWGIGEVAARPGARRRAAVAACAAAVAALSAATWVEAARWRDSVTLSARALAVTRDNWFVLANLGIALHREGMVHEAMGRYAESLRIHPENPNILNNLGVAYFQTGRVEEAVRIYREALRIKPDHAKSHYNLAVVLAASGAPDEALAQYRETLRIDPGYARAHNGLGLLLARSGFPEEAVAHFREAVRLDPGFDEARRNLEEAVGGGRDPAGGAGGRRE